MKKIQLTQNKIAIVDDEDFEKVNQYKWCYHSSGSGRAYTNGNIQMHRLIMDVCDKSIYVDHINGDTLDNRKENLRLCSHSENMRNRRIVAKNNKSGCKGVYKRGKRWVAQISFNNQVFYLGTFDTKEMAAKNYDLAAIKYHGKFARLNEE